MKAFFASYEFCPSSVHHSLIYSHISPMLLPTTIVNFRNKYDKVIPQQIRKIGPTRKSVSRIYAFRDETQIIVAIHNKKDVEIQYKSMSSPEPLWRWITPHSFWFNGMRWHKMIEFDMQGGGKTIQI